MAQMPTVDDVARIAQVSRQTVSNVINAPDVVRPATRERVEQAIAQLGYRPNASARRLRSQKSSTIGIRLAPMGDGISGAVLDRFLHSLTEGADARGMRILLFTAADDAAEIDQIRRLRDDRDADAFVLTSTWHGDARTRWLLDEKVPFVTFGRPWGADDLNDPLHHWVDVDGSAGVRAATEHLLEGGARRVAFLGWPSPSSTGDDRRSGWVAAMIAGVPEADLRSLTLEAEEDVPGARAVVSSYLDAHPETDAIVCASDSLALGALMAANAAGRPDLGITGFDNTPVAEAVGLTSVEQRLGLVADAVLELLLGSTGSAVSLGDPLPGEAHRLIAPQLVVRSRHHGLAGTADDSADPAGQHRHAQERETQ